MNFKLTTAQKYWWPVTVRLPDPDRPGKIIKQRFKMQFEAQPRDQVIADQERLNALTGLSEIAEHEYDMLRRACTDWKDVDGEDGKPAPFTREAFDAQLQRTQFRVAVYEAYNESQSGEEARLGN